MPRATDIIGEIATAIASGLSARGNVFLPCRLQPYITMKGDRAAIEDTMREEIELRGDS